MFYLLFSLTYVQYIQSWYFSVHSFQIHKVPGFLTVLLQVVMSNDIQIPVRQAGMSPSRDLTMKVEPRSLSLHIFGKPTYVSRVKSKLAPVLGLRIERLTC